MLRMDSKRLSRSQRRSCIHRDIAGRNKIDVATSNFKIRKMDPEISYAWHIPIRPGHFVMMRLDDAIMLRRIGIRRIFMSNNYPAIKYRGEMIYLHRFLKGCWKGDGREIDHHDQIRLNAHLSNLFDKPTQINRVNRWSEYGGVTQSTKGKAWRVQIGYHYKQYRQSHETKVEAQNAHNRIMRILYNGYVLPFHQVPAPDCYLPYNPLPGHSNNIPDLISAVAQERGVTFESLYSQL